jgi:hypothetical protein
LLRLCLVKLLCAGSFFLPSGDAEGGYQWEVHVLDGWAPYWEAPKALTVAEGGTLGHGVVRLSSIVLAFAYRLSFCYENSDVLNSNL